MAMVQNKIPNTAADDDDAKQKDGTTTPPNKNSPNDVQRPSSNLRLLYYSFTFTTVSKCERGYETVSSFSRNRSRVGLFTRS